MKLLLKKTSFKKTRLKNSLLKKLKKLPVLLLAAPLLLLTACSTLSNDATTDDVSVEDRTGGTGSDGQNGAVYEGQTGAYDDSGMAAGSAMNGQAYEGDPLSDPNSSLSIRTIYFDYDSTVINSQGQLALNAHAEYLSLNPSKTIIIEGHTDERGTREYNLSLGERRARSVADFLSASGVPSQQMDVRSYGEENPVALDHYDSAWQLNRRVELLY